MVLGNKMEMEITKYVEENPVILQLGIHFEFNDSRARVAAQLQKNRDRCKYPPPAAWVPLLLTPAWIGLDADKLEQKMAR